MIRTKKGIVTAQKQDKTLVATVHSYRNHPKYKKRYRVSKKFQIHNPENAQFELGETITFYETRPISKLKKWTLINPETNKQS